MTAPKKAPNVSKPAPQSSEDLDMVPLQQADAEQVDDGSPKSATAFFALPQPKRKEPEPEPEAPAAAPPSGPPGMGGGMQGGGGMPPMMGGGGGMGIQGPVAGGPVAQPGGQYGMGGPSLPPPDDGQDRARSYRVFAVVAGLMFMVCTALILMGALVVGASMMQQDDGPDTPTTTAAQPAPSPRQPRVIDTGIKGPKPKPKPRPRPSSGPRPSPVPAAPAPPPPPPAPPAGPAAATIKIPGSAPFTGVEVTCPISGFRNRATFAGGSATIADVPQEDCQVIFKGGPPARNTIRGGQTKSCDFPSGQAVCN